MLVANKTRANGCGRYVTQDGAKLTAFEVVDVMRGVEFWPGTKRQKSVEVARVAFENVHANLSTMADARAWVRNR